MVRNIRWAAAAVVLGTASVAAAQEDQSLPEKAEEQAEQKVEQVKASAGAANFGHVNQLVISQDMAFNLATDINDDATDSLSIELSPAADYFIQENLSLGGFVTLDHTIIGGGAADVTNLGIGVRAGYNIPVAENASIWPKVGFAIANRDVPGATGGSTGGDTSAELSVDAPVLFHPANHFFVGFGPAVTFRIGGADGIGLALNSVVGGYF
jgi:hypothetical protein